MPPPINTAQPLPPPPLAQYVPYPSGPEQSAESTGNFASQRRLAWIAPLFAALLAVIGTGVGEPTASATLLGAAVVAILVGLTFGIIALGNIGRHGKRGLLARRWSA